MIFHYFSFMRSKNTIINIENILNEKIDKKYFLGCKNFGLNNDCFSFGFFSKDLNCDYKYSSKIMFSPEHTKNGIFLNYENIDLAVLGFNIDSEKKFSDCLQIQGRKGMYKYLSSILWDRALFERFIKISKVLELDFIKSVTSYEVKGEQAIKNLMRYNKRYDYTARGFGFKYIEPENRFVLRIK